MPNKLQRIFRPTPEEQIEDLKKILQIVHDAPDTCCNCIHSLPPDPCLPGYVTDYGICKLFPNANIFCIDEVGCEMYSRVTATEEDIKQQIAELELKRKEQSNGQSD